MDRAQIKMARLNSAARMIREKKKVSIYVLAAKTGLSVDYARKEYRAIPELFDDISFDNTTFYVQEEPKEGAEAQEAEKEKMEV